MAKIKDITDIVEEIAGVTPYFVEDNIGLLLGDGGQEVSGVICCLDVTQSVINQAIKHKANLIISHHPFIFTPIKAILRSTPLGGKIHQLIKHDISVYSAHTNLDFCPQGINQFGATLLNLQNIQPMDGIFGRIGDIVGKNGINQQDFARFVGEKFDCGTSVYGDLNRAIKRVAFVNGAGGGDTHTIDLAVDLGADCLITSEIKHHVCLYAQERSLNLVELPHFSAERCYIPCLVDKINKEIENKNLKIDVFLAEESLPKTRI